MAAAEPPILLLLPLPSSHCRSRTPWWPPPPPMHLPVDVPVRHHLNADHLLNLQSYCSYHFLTLDLKPWQKHFLNLMQMMPDWCLTKITVALGCFYFNFILMDFILPLNILTYKCPHHRCCDRARSQSLNTCENFREWRCCSSRCYSWLYSLLRYLLSPHLFFSHENIESIT